MNWFFFWVFYVNLFIQTDKLMSSFLEILKIQFWGSSDNFWSPKNNASLNKKWHFKINLGFLTIFCSKKPIQSLAEHWPSKHWPVSRISGIRKMATVSPTTVFQTILYHPIWNINFGKKSGFLLSFLKSSLSSTYFQFNKLLSERKCSCMFLGNQIAYYQMKWNEGSPKTDQNS